MPTTDLPVPARRRLRRPFVVAALAASAAVLAGSSGLSSAFGADAALADDASGEREDPDDRGDFAPIGVLPANEGSGAAASRAYPGVVWALRDSGGGPHRVALYAFKVADGHLVDLDPGVKVRVFPVRGASNGDWEALTVDDRGNLYVADIGNNGCRRDGLRVYRVAEPNPYAAGSASVEATYPVDWPSVAGPCTGHNAESVFALDGSLYVVSKNHRPGVYRLDLASPGRPLVKVADVEPPRRGFRKTPTDAAVSADGRRLVLATAAYRMYVYEASHPGLTGDELVRDLVSRPPRWSQRYRQDGGNRQVEGVSFSRDGHDVVLLSEGRTIQHFPARFYEQAGEDGHDEDEDDDEGWGGGN